MARRVKSRSLKVIDAVISTCTEEELEKFRLKGALNLDFRQQLILVLGKRIAKCSPRKAKKKFESFKAAFARFGEKGNWTTRSNLYVLDYLRNSLFI